MGDEPGLSPFRPLEGRTFGGRPTANEGMDVVDCSRWNSAIVYLIVPSSFEHGSQRVPESDMQASGHAPVNVRVTCVTCLKTMESV